MTHQTTKPNSSRHIGTCESCWKRSYVTRKDAKATIRHVNDPAMRAYRCPAGSGYFHIGHIPQAVRDGRMTVGQIYGATVQPEQGAP